MTVTAATAPGHQAEPLLRRAAPALLFTAVLLLTALLMGWSMLENAAERRALLQRSTSALRLSLAAELRSRLDILPGLRLLASGPAPLDDAAFSRHAGALIGADRYPGLVLSFVAERVSADELPAYLARVRADRSADAAGHASFAVQPPGERPEYMLLRHQFPPDPTNDGYDLYDPAAAYRPAVERAIVDGGLVATPPLLLARDRHRPAHAELTSIVVRAATYRGGLPPPGAAARRQAATGVVGIALRSAELVRSALPAELAVPARTRVRISDPAAPAGAALVYDSAPGSAAPASALRFTLPVADRQWRVEVAAVPQPWWQHADGGTWALGAAGLSCATALAALTAGLGRARRRAERRLRDGLARLEQEKAQLARSEHRLRLLFDHSLDAILNTRANGGIVAANRAARELFGRTEAELLAASRGDILDLDDPRVAALLAERHATGRARGQVRMRRGDGSTFEAEISSMGYVDSDGSPLASVIVRDLAPTLAATAERQQLEAQLRHAQKMQAVGTLAGGIAHDFNNVLAIVLGGTALLDAELPADHAARPHLQRIRQAGLRARSLVQQLLAFGRPPAEGRWAQPLQPLVEEAVSLLRLGLPATVTLDVKLAATPMHAVTEPTQIQQVLINLCNNAWQAMPGHRGRIEIALETALIDERPWALISVRDDGAGMDAALRERIFEPFFTTKAPGQGTGLGLAMVHGIVTGHGGRIEVSSAPGHGSVFDIWLPAVDAPAGDRIEDAPAPADVRGQGELIIYLDDDEVLRLTVEALLLRQGWRVQTHGEPAEALAAVAAAPQDVALVVTDYHMPGMSGVQVADAVQRQRAGLPVLILTGEVTDELASAAGRAGLGVMRKEFIAEQLAARVAQLIAAARPATP